MALRRRKSEDFFRCPVCGAEVPADAAFCRECGASDDSGWNEEGYPSDADSPEGYGPEDDFDYDDFIRREFPEQAGPRPPWSAKRWAILVIVALLAAALAISAAGW